MGGREAHWSGSSWWEGRRPTSPAWPAHLRAADACSPFVPPCISFRGQYAIEVAAALTACGLLWRIGGGSVRGGLAALTPSGGWLLAGAAAVLLLELGFVFPALDLRGKALIASSAQPAELTPRQQAYVQALQDDVSARPLPPPFVHLVSVLLAVAQAGMLGGFVWQMLLSLVVAA